MSKTIEEIKEQVAKEYTSGKSGWYGNYLSERIKLVLMNEVAKLYAQSQTEKWDKHLDILHNLIDHIQNNEVNPNSRIDKLINIALHKISKL